MVMNVYEAWIWKSRQKHGREQVGFLMNIIKRKNVALNNVNGMLVEWAQLWYFVGRNATTSSQMSKDFILMRCSRLKWNPKSNRRVRTNK